MTMIDEAALNTFVGKMLGDLGGVFSVPTVRIGIRLGLFEALHEGGPATAADLAARMRRIVADDGTWMIVEPNAGDTPADNMNPVGRLFYNASTMICIPTSLDQEVGECLGAQAGEARLSEVIRSGGFGSVRRATDGPFNMVLEARL
jgi:hypothetical protein